MALFIRVTSRMVSGKVQEFKCGPTMLDTRENGEITKLMAEVSSGMLMVMYMKENGKTIRPMAMERIPM